jgi:hypothetical protein
MLREIGVGVAAGAAGTVALDAASYTDMAIRGRPASSMPAQVAGELAEKIGLDLAFGGAGGETVQNRKSALGALLGYADGLGTGAAYGLLRAVLGEGPGRKASVLLLTLAAMAGSDGPAAALGLTDPRQWPLESWVSDIVFHLAYGLAVAAAYDALV